MNGTVYWKGKCEKCKYSSGFSDRYGLVWTCNKFNVPMFLVEKHQCPNGAYYPTKKGNINEKRMFPRMDT